MPVTAKDFKIYNSTPEYVRHLDQAFDYFRAKFPNADAGLRYLLDTGKQFMNNSPGNPYVAPKDAGTDAYGKMDGHDIILWDPDTGLLVTKDGKVTGIESAADGLAHEIWGHGLNPANDAMLNIPDSPEYQTLNERVAVGIESSLNTIFGEPLRDNHYGTEVWTSDVTVHTITTEDGALQLVRTDAFGHDEYGPQIDYSSSGWDQLQHAFDQIDLASGRNAASDDSGIETVWTPDQPISLSVGNNDANDSPSGGTGNRDASGQEWGGGPDENDGPLGSGSGDYGGGADGSGPGGGRNRDWHEDDSAPAPGVLTDTPVDLTGGSAWLEHLSHGSVPIVGVPHLDAGMLML